MFCILPEFFEEIVSLNIERSEMNFSGGYIDE